MSVLSTHLLSFVEETKLTRDEWMRAIQFLTATGQKCDDVRQEFILLSDVLVCVDAGRDDQSTTHRLSHRTHGARTLLRARCASTVDG